MSPPPGTALAACARPLVDAYDVALLDLDGVLYLGEEPVPHAADAVRAVRAQGMRTAYVTNNASRAADVVAAHLHELGIPADVDDVVTSGQAAARLVAEHVPAGSAVLVLGTDALADQLRSRGLQPVRTVEEARDAGPAAVLQGIAPDTDWRDLAEACLALRRGAVWVAGNLDATLPTARGQLPGNGAMVAALRTATGLEPLVAGKPEPALHAEAVQRTGAQRPLVVGDRLDTDILGAVRAGADSLLVLTGVVDLPTLLSAPAGSRPGFVGADLRALTLPQPEVRTSGTAAMCGQATARLEGDVVRVQLPEAGRPQGDVEGLRAACALAWQAVDAGREVPTVDGLGELRAGCGA
jgi:glycerol 3-phosphatase-2